MNLKVLALDNLEVTLSPFVNAPQKIIVQSLLNEYAPNAILKESKLVGSIKLK